MTDEPHALRLKRLSMRSMRRGTKEMDLILMRFSAARLAQMTPTELDSYEALLNENDQDLYLWVTGQAAPPEAIRPMVEEIATLIGAQ